MKPSIITNLLQLRTLVGFLGERSQFGWWPSAFFDAPSRRFLEPVFTNTVEVAQYHGMLEAARRFHDQHLDVGHYHLFRLPEELEQSLFAAINEPSGSELVRQITTSADDALSKLATIADSREIAAVGPTQIGTIANLSDRAAIPSIAAIYRDAFPSGRRAFPYLSE
jgi:hypothetical protein